MPTEKDGLETGAITEFAEALGSEIGTGRFLFKELRNPPEPDGFCLLDGKPLHIEVGHVYGAQSDAKQLLGRTGMAAPSDEEKILSTLIPLERRSLLPLNRLLVNKATKTYQASRVWLVVRSALPMWSRQDFVQHKAGIFVQRTKKPAGT